MDPKAQEDNSQDIQGYTLAAAAHMLNIHPSTLRFWEESFRQELGVPRNWKGDLVFSDAHLEIIRRIQRMVMGEGHTLAEARRAARTGDFPNYDDVPVPDEGHAATPAVMGDRGPAVGATASPSPTPSAAGPADPWRKELEEIRGSLTQLMEHVAYLLEENRSFQELFTRLVNHVENSGIVPYGSMAKSQGFVSEPPISERIVGHEIVESFASREMTEDQAAAAFDPPDPADDLTLWPSDELDDLSQLEELHPPSKKPHFQAGLTTQDDRPVAASPSPGHVIGTHHEGGRSTIQSWVPGDLGGAKDPHHADDLTQKIRKQFAS